MANYNLFISKAPGVMHDLMQDFDFSTIQAAAILGNLGHECDGFRTLQERNPAVGRGGLGWAQWTGPRRRAFETWCARMGYDLRSDTANYGFLVVELRGSEAGAERALKRESNLVRAVRVFERKFLRAGIPHYPSRERYAEIALTAFEAERNRVAIETEVAAVEAMDDWFEDGLEALEGTSVRYAARVGATHDCDCSGKDTPYRDLYVAEEVLEADEEDFFEAGIAAATEPIIHPTSSWNARPPSNPVRVLNQKPKGIVIHHTASRNVSDTSLSHAKSLARTIQNHHMYVRHFIDSGQHFLVSRGGHILESRHRSLEIARQASRHVEGAHAPNCNTRYVGIENEGIYMTERPPDLLWGSLVRLCAWLCNQYAMDTDNIIGHRQCSSTDCPGDALFPLLLELRRDVDAAR